MLFLPVGAPKPMRVQGCYASDEEIEGVTNYIKNLLPLNIMRRLKKNQENCRRRNYSG